MRWGERSAKPESLSWVRPAAFDHRRPSASRPKKPDVIKFAIDGIEAGQTTHGSLRFMAPAVISVRRFEDYEANG